MNFMCSGWRREGERTSRGGPCMIWIFFQRPFLIFYKTCGKTNGTMKKDILYKMVGASLVPFAMLARRRTDSSNYPSRMYIVSVRSLSHIHIHTHTQRSRDPVIYTKDKRQKWQI